MLSLLLWMLSHSVGCATDIPVIGVVPQPCQVGDVNFCSQYSPNAMSYVPASYTQWLQMSGAQIIPFYFTYQETQLRQLFSQINGILIVGGSAPTQPIAPYEKFIQLIMSLSREFHTNSVGHNESMPIYGICDGFENMITALCESGEQCMGQFAASDMELPVTFDMHAVNDSLMFNLSDTHSIYYGYKQLVIELLSSKNISYNDHHKGITPAVFKNDPYVSSNFTILATSFDSVGKEFVTLIESHTELGLNWFASQFHPEKSSFEFTRPSIAHSYDAVVANAWFSQFFVEQCRRGNSNTMNESVFSNLTLYNFDPVWTDSSAFEQVYYFPQ